MMLRRILLRVWDYLMRLPRILPLSAMAFVMMLTVISTFAFERSERESRQLELQVAADHLAAALEQNMATNIAVLQSGSALLTSIDNVDLATFRRFVANQRADGTDFGVRGVGWSRAVRRDQVAALEREIRAQGNQSFRVWPRLPPENAKEHTIVFLGPDDAENRKVLGFDMFNEAIRRQAMRQAARTGTAAATMPITLMQDSGRQNGPGVLIYVPVFNGDPKAMSPSQREGALEGFVYSPIRIKDFFAFVERTERIPSASLEIVDNVGPTNSTLLKQGDRSVSNLEASQMIKVANREWKLTLYGMRPTPLSPLAIAILGFGVALSALLGMLTALILLGSRHTQANLRARQEYETVRNVLTRELTHRVKNTLATVSSLAMLTKRGATNVEDYVQGFTARLRALSATHDLLMQRDWNDAPILQVLEAEFAPYSGSNDVRLLLQGPEVILLPNIALSFGLAIHELITNAAKYGALSVPSGSVSVTWALAANGQTANVIWQESGGPGVETPTHRGFGSDLIEKLMVRELGSEVKISFDKAGVRCNLTLPVHTPPRR